MKPNKILFSAAVLLMTCGTIGAKTRSTAAFLQLGVGARELSMGGAGAALSNDVNALYWNPGALAEVKNSQIGLTHAEWFLDTRYDFAGFTRSLSVGTIGVSGTYFTKGQQDGRNESRQKTGEFTAADTAVSVAYALPLNSALALGTNVKIIDSRIDHDHASGVALDLGAHGKLRAISSSWGLSVRNLGPKLSYAHAEEPLPLTFAMGIGHTLLPGLNLATEVQNEPYDHKSRFIFGTEYGLAGSVSLRAGFTSTSHRAAIDNDSSPLVGGLMGGVGLKILSYNLDYAFTPQGALGDGHRFSFLARF